MAGETTDLSERASESKRKIGRSVSINGVHAIDVELNKSANLNDPIVDLNVRLNNPLGRLWLALKRIWKSQNTVLDFKFTIPLLVLPVAIYVGWVLWQGRGVNTPMTKLGVLHEVVVGGQPRDILILPTSDVYMVEYTGNFDPRNRLAERPIVAIGVYNHLDNILRVESVIPYSSFDLPSKSPVIPEPRTVWDSIWDFIEQFR